MYALRQLYNAVLSEGFKRLDRLRSDPAFEPGITALKRARKAEDEEAVKTARAVLTALEKQYQFSEYAFHPFAATCRKSCWINDHIDSVSTQTIASRAFRALNEYRFGKRGKPRFKSWTRAITSVEGKAKACLTIKLADEKKNRPIRFAWNTLEFPLVLDRKDKYGYETHALEAIANGEWKFCRLIHRIVRSKPRLYLQVIMNGVPFVKRKHRERFAAARGQIGGIDIGPSTIAAVTDHEALLQPFCPEVEDTRQQIARLQRQQSRRLRLANPAHFTAHEKRVGRQTKTIYKVKKGIGDWQRSRNYQNDQARLKELHRRLAAQRQHSHHQLAIKLLSMATVWNTERLSFKAFQKLFGCSVGFRAPSAFVETLRHKAANAGGEVNMIDTWSAKLSQYDHVSDTYRKKSLSERVHYVGNDAHVPIQRDLYSAFLARVINADRNHPCRSHALAAWTSIRPILERTQQGCKEKSIGLAWPTSLFVPQHKPVRDFCPQILVADHEACAI